MSSLDQILALFDNGEFLADLLRAHRLLMVDLLYHRAEFPGVNARWSMKLHVTYDLSKSSEVSMTATRVFKAPKKPGSSAAAYIKDDGEPTLFSPFMTRMQRPVRYVTDHDPETGEVRDV
jgi:hypothetical protein